MTGEKMMYNEEIYAKLEKTLIEFCPEQFRPIAAFYLPNALAQMSTEEMEEVLETVQRLENESPEDQLAALLAWVKKKDPNFVFDPQMLAMIMG